MEEVPQTRPSRSRKSVAESGSRRSSVAFADDAAAIQEELHSAAGISLPPLPEAETPKAATPKRSPARSPPTPGTKKPARGAASGGRRPSPVVLRMLFVIFVAVAAVPLAALLSTCFFPGVTFPPPAVKQLIAPHAAALCPAAQQLYKQALDQAANARKTAVGVLEPAAAHAVRAYRRLVETAASVELPAQLAALLGSAPAAPHAAPAAFGNVLDQQAFASLLAPGHEERVADLYQSIAHSNARAQKATGVLLACGSEYQCTEMVLAARAAAVAPECLEVVHGAEFNARSGESPAGRLQQLLARFIARCPHSVVVIDNIQDMATATLPVLNNVLSESGSLTVDGKPVRMRGTLVILTMRGDAAGALASASPADVDTQAKIEFSNLMSAVAMAQVGSDSERYRLVTTTIMALRRRIDFAAPARAFVPPPPPPAAEEYQQQQEQAAAAAAAEVDAAQAAAAYAQQTEEEAATYTQEAAATQ